MKKTFLALATLVGLIGGTLYFTPAEASAAVIVADSPCGVNPYDNYGMPVMPWPYCGLEMHLDSGCVAAKQAAFEAEATAAIATAQYAWNLSCGKRTQAIADAWKLFNNCPSETNPQCQIRLNEDLLAAENTFLSETAAIGSTLSATIAALQAQYLETLRECCVDDE